MCACGCRSKVRTPIGPTEWSIREDRGGPTLRPSVGNWQRPCRSHYWIIDGAVEWSPQWTRERIEAGRMFEQLRREAYYRNRNPQNPALRFWRWLKFFLFNKS
ncbi:DUF6527 family protein [Sphingorhabdus sp.]|uniref:DUF6527 family protein n=1 Tax=Sphingorhabdus sp. TaxID=1902408 RepID=UPI0035B41BC2